MRILGLENICVCVCVRVCACVHTHCVREAVSERRRDTQCSRLCFF